MNEKNKAHLERKLRLPPVPPPPAGLAERIKQDIPDPLRVGAEGERQRFNQSIRMTFRIAASVLILTLGTFVMLQVFSRSKEAQPPAIAAARKAVPIAAVTAAPQPPAEVAQSQPAALEPTRAQRKERPKAQPEAAFAEERPRLADQKREEKTDSIAADTSAMQSAPAAPVPTAAPAAAGGVGAAAAKVSENTALAPARLDAEVTVSPKSGRTMLLISTRNAPDSTLDVEGARKIEDGLYSMQRDNVTIRLRYRADGKPLLLEKKVSRADVRPWNEASERMKDAVSAAESSPP